MRRYFALVCFILLFTCLFVIARTPFVHSNNPMLQYTMDNGILAQTMTPAMPEWVGYGQYSECVWQPFNPDNSLLYQADFWVCNNTHAVCSPELYPDVSGWYNLNGSSGLYRPGDTGWPPSEPVLSDHDTLAFFTDHGRIGLQVKRHTLMWDSSSDSDYFIVQYYITNTTTSNMNDLYMARMSDFDLVGMGSTYMDNVIGSDSATHTVWSRDRLDFPFHCWVGIRGLTFDINSMNYWDIFGDPRSEAAVIGLMQMGWWLPVSTANDWRILAIHGPFGLTAGTTRNFTLAVAFGSSFNEMQTNLDRAKWRYGMGTPQIQTTTLGQIRGLYH